jgi:hypothetical protein
VPPCWALAALAVETALCAAWIAELYWPAPDELLEDELGFSATVHRAKKATVPMSNAMSGRGTLAITHVVGSSGHHHEG